MNAKDFQVRIKREFKDIMPGLSKVELEGLRADILQLGKVRLPIVTDEDGNILDGHNRWEIYRTNKGKVPRPEVTVIKDLGSDAAKMAWIIQTNMNRRSLSWEQRSQLGETLKGLVRQLRVAGLTQLEIGAKTGVPRRTISFWLSGEDGSDGNVANASLDLRYTIPRSAKEPIWKRWKAGETQAVIADDLKVTRERIGQICRQVEASKRPPEKLDPDKLPDGVFQAIVIDPPWPIQKIERETRPDQGPALDYRTMTLEEISGLKENIAKKAASSGCHIYLWVTHRFLPDGFGLFNEWGVTYQCLMTWVKNVGITPFSWMYDTEHVLFGRIGSLPLLKNGERLSFSAPITKHSEKPDIFYERVAKVSPGPRLDWFGRKERPGFVIFGNKEARA